MKNILGFLFLISLIASIILLFISVCNYLIAYYTTGEKITEAFQSNIYVRYWLNLLAFFVGTLAISFLGFILLRPKVVEDEGYYVYENQRRIGNAQGPVDEYVTVRVKKDELSKLQG